LSIDSYGVVDEMRLQLARTQGELEAARAQLAGLIAAEEQWRVELEAAKEDAASSRTSLVHLQNQYEERLQLKNGHIARLEQELAEAECRRRAAERERAAVIAVLGRRARKHLQAGSEGEPL
jgi:septation ring formation regulator EzrA